MTDINPGFGKIRHMSRTKSDVIQKKAIHNAFIHKMRGELFVVEQDTIKYVSAAYLKFILIIQEKKSLISKQLFSADTM